MDGASFCSDALTSAFSGSKSMERRIELDLLSPPIVDVAAGEVGVGVAVEETAPPPVMARAASPAVGVPLKPKVPALLPSGGQAGW
mmetsp:Transcript_105795/g.225816  ORF Transcript_105795/g.225816 Transcript_105795/m.225816 type:complete len:86 (-) Transcript_105795:2591-2848(-)